MVTPAYKWLRAVGDHEFTGLHMDRVFMGRSPRMLTAWIPLGEVPIAQGPILVSFCYTRFYQVYASSAHVFFLGLYTAARALSCSFNSLSTVYVVHADGLQVPCNVSPLEGFR